MSDLWRQAMNIEDAVDGYDPDPIVPKGVHPIPYIQRGMLLTSTMDSAEWWVVETVIGPSPCIATLRSNDIRRINVPCQDLQRLWELYEDFDPGDDFIDGGGDD